MPLCSVCELEKPNTEFYFRKDRPLGRLSHCRACHAIRRNNPKYKARKKAYLASYYQANKARLTTYSRTHYRANLERCKAQARARYAAQKARGVLSIKRNEPAINALKNRPCADCGGRFLPCAMDFDHRPDTVKLYEISTNRTRRLERLMAEIAKCDLVCANCHRVRTWKRANERRLKRSGAIA